MFFIDPNKTAMDPKWSTLNRALIQEVAAAARARAFEQQLDGLIKSDNAQSTYSAKVTTAQTNSQARPQESSVWEPSEAAAHLLEVINRNGGASPTLNLQIKTLSQSIEDTKSQIKSQIDASGINYHSSLAKIAGGDNLASLAPTIAHPQGPNPHDAATMLMVSGQLKTMVETPMGPAIVLWHRLEDSDSSSHTAKHKFNSVSIAIDHHDLGTIVAHVYAKPMQLNVLLSCQESSLASVRQQSNILYTLLLDIAPSIKIHAQADSHE